MDSRIKSSLLLRDESSCFHWSKSRFDMKNVNTVRPLRSIGTNNQLHFSISNQKIVNVFVSDSTGSWWNILNRAVSTSLSLMMLNYDGGQKPQRLNWNKNICQKCQSLTFRGTRGDSYLWAGDGWEVRMPRASSDTLPYFHIQSVHQDLLFQSSLLSLGLRFCHICFDLNTTDRSTPPPTFTFNFWNLRLRGLEVWAQRWDNRACTCCQVKQSRGAGDTRRLCPVPFLLLTDGTPLSLQHRPRFRWTREALQEH